MEINTNCIQLVTKTNSHTVWEGLCRSVNPRRQGAWRVLLQAASHSPQPKCCIAETPSAKERGTQELKATQKKWSWGTTVKSESTKALISHFYFDWNKTADNTVYKELIKQGHIKLEVVGTAQFPFYDALLTRNFFRFPCQQFSEDSYNWFRLVRCRYYVHQEGFFCPALCGTRVPLSLICSESCSGYNPKGTTLAKCSLLVRYLGVRMITVPQGLASGYHPHLLHPKVRAGGLSIPCAPGKAVPLARTAPRTCPESAPHQPLLPGLPLHLLHLLASNSLFKLLPIRMTDNLLILSPEFWKAIRGIKWSEKWNFRKN